MPLRAWLRTFHSEVVTIEETVSREIEVTRHLLKHPHHPVYFKDLEGYEAVGNLWSTRERIASALRTNKRDLVLRIL